MRFYTTSILSANQELTPEGFLLCRNVPIGRTGVQLYAAGELPLEALDGLIRIERAPEHVFDASTMASFEAKPVTLDHPASDVTPRNWSSLAKGVVQNVRRGSSIEDDLLLADLLITDHAAIQQVRDGLREVSCGYDAEYEQIEPGRGRQLSIIGNHVALVEKGRCGTRCAIGDSMTKTKWMDRLRAAFKAHDEKELEEALKESAKDEASESAEEKEKREKAEADKKTSDALSKALDELTERIDKLEKDKAKDKSKDEESETAEEKEKREKEEKEKSGDKARDSAALVAEAQDVFARVEILSPGMALPTVDAADPKKFVDSLCALKRKALAAAFENPKTRDAVAPLVATRDLSTLTCDALHSTFVGASEIVRRENNTQTKVTFDSGKSASTIASTISEMNRRNSQFWNRSN